MEFVSTGKNVLAFLHEPKTEPSQSTQLRHSQWSYTSQLCGLAPVQQNASNFLRIDKY